MAFARVKPLQAAWNFGVWRGLFIEYTPGVNQTVRVRSTAGRLPCPLYVDVPASGGRVRVRSAGPCSASPLSQLYAVVEGSGGSIPFANLYSDFWLASAIPSQGDDTDLLSWPSSVGSTPWTGNPGATHRYRTSAWFDGGAAVEAIGSATRFMSADSLATLFEGNQTPFSVYTLIRPDAGNTNIISATTAAAGPYESLDVNTSPRLRSQRSIQADGGGAALSASQLAVFLNGPNSVGFVYDGTQIRTFQDDFLDSFVAHDRNPLVGLTRFTLGLFRRNTSSLPGNGLFRAIGIAPGQVFGQAQASGMFDWAMPSIGAVAQFGSSLVVGTGSSGQSGWRRPLYGLYRQDGLYPRFTGTQVDGAPTFSQTRHDGYSGISLASMIATAPTIVANMPLQPALLLLLAGQGDMTGYSSPGTIDSYYQLLETLHALLPLSCAFCVTTLTPWDPVTNPLEAANTNSFNAELPPAWAAFQAQYPQRVLLFADLNSAIGGPNFVPANFSDHVHPNNDGYNLCALGWYTPTQLYLASLPLAA